MIFTWQWWVAQSFALVALILVICSNLSKDIKGITKYKLISTSFSFTGICFLGQMAAIILNAIGILRGTVAVILAYHPNIPNKVRWSLAAMIIVILISLNIIFYTSYTSILSMIVGTGLIIAFMQKKASVIRIITVIMCSISTTLYVIINSPISALMDFTSLASAFIGIIRIDLKKEKYEVIG